MRTLIWTEKGDLLLRLRTYLLWLNCFIRKSTMSVVSDCFSSSPSSSRSSRKELPPSLNFKVTFGSLSACRFCLRITPSPFIISSSCFWIGSIKTSLNAFAYWTNIGSKSGCCRSLTSLEPCIDICFSIFVWFGLIISLRNCREFVSAGFSCYRSCCLCRNKSCYCFLPPVVFSVSFFGLLGLRDLLKFCMLFLMTSWFLVFLILKDSYPSI